MGPQLIGLLREELEFSLKVVRGHQRVWSALGKGLISASEQSLLNRLGARDCASRTGF